LGPYQERIEQILKEDQLLPRKQRHTAKRIWERLKEAGFTGGYTVVKEAVRELTQRSQEVFVPLTHPPHFSTGVYSFIGRIEDALRYLSDIPVEQWNACSSDEWFQANYPKPDGTYGPIHLEWTSDPKPKSSAESNAHAIEILRARWDEVAGQELSGVTSPAALFNRRLQKLARTGNSHANDACQGSSKVQNHVL
jgi:hypothetical protein